MEPHSETPRPVRITARGPQAKIEVDGKHIDPGALNGYFVSHLSGESAHVILYPEDSGDTSFEGLARVSVAEALATGPTAATFLTAIDPEELERAALGRPDLGTGPHSLTRAMLTQLEEWARGI
ncbi:hypothetical protein [Streptomyces sp. NPDC048644]|uniref:hypothetical protein n=1 Tax=Streptomyces sp. NPDC048644 TaxID=3365582 RepID=UPI00371F3A47